jgi:FkbM family methyltransferase
MAGLLQQQDGRRRPLPMRLLPPRLRLSMWARYYRQRRQTYAGLYEDACLEYAPGVRMRLQPGDVISDAIAFTGIYELALTRRVIELASRGGLLVEVGANLGYFSLLWGASSPRNSVIAIEASPRNIALLQSNVARNGLDARIRVLGIAAGAQPGRMTFDPGPADQTGWGGLSAAATPGSLSVDVVRLDDVIAPGDTVALLKIDAEGADTWILEGCSGLLARRAIGEIWFEQNRPRMRALGIPPERADARLRELGYEAHPEGDPAAEVVEWRALPRR